MAKEDYKELRTQIPAEIYRELNAMTCNGEVKMPTIITRLARNAVKTGFKPGGDYKTTLKKNQL